MPFNDILENQIHPLGLWQVRTFLLLIFSSPFSLTYFPVFPGLRPHYFCRPIGFGKNNWTLIQWINLTAPVFDPPPDKGQRFQGCLAFDLPTTVNLSMNFLNARSAMDEALLVGNISAQPCSNGWVYLSETAVYGDTLVANFDLVCSRSSLMAWSTAVFMLGFLVGAPAFGAVGDRLGRKRAGIIALMCVAVAVPVTSFAPSIAIFMVGRFFLGIFIMGHYVVIYTLLMEISGAKARDMFTILMSAFVAVLSLSWYTFLAYFIRNWRWLHMACSTCVLTVILYFPYMPESPRWLITEDRYEESLKEIRKALRVNRAGEEISLHVTDLQPISPSNDSSNPKTETRPGITQLVKTPTLRRITLLTQLPWFINSLAYYGTSFYSVKLPIINPFLSFSIPSISKVTFIVIELIIAGRFHYPRRACLAGSQILGSLCCAVVAFIYLFPGVDEDKKNIITLVSMSIFLVFVVMSYNGLYVYTSELFPTSLRGRGLGVCSMVGRIGATVSPLIIDWDQSIGLQSLPLSVLSGIIFISGIASCLLPETKNRPMVETVKQLEKVYGRHKEDKGKMRNEIQQS